MTSTTKLDAMTEVIRSFIHHTTDPIVLARTYRALEDFCWGYPPEFGADFFKMVGADSGITALPRAKDVSAENRFVEKLCEVEGQCVFLLNDAGSFYKKYHDKTGGGTGIVINREYLGGEDVYFTLLNNTYTSYMNSDSLDTLLDVYTENLRKILASDPVLNQKSREIFSKVSTERMITWVDVGFQFTINLFCYACVRIHSNDKIVQDMYNFSACPWLAHMFKDKFFTERCELVRGIESRK